MKQKSPKANTFKHLWAIKVFEAFWGPGGDQIEAKRGPK